MPSRAGGIAEPSPADKASDRAAGFLSRASMEILPRGANPVAGVTRHLAPGTEVYVACIPGEDYGRIIALSSQLRRAGFVPVPHLPARGVKDRAVLHDRLTRLTGEAGVDRLLLLGGDINDQAVGDYASALQVLQTGLLAQLGMKAVGFGTYPEPHQIVPEAVLERELRQKLSAAADQGLDRWLVSQFCYDPAIIIRHARRLRADGVEAPLHVGVSGPASWASMAKFALICGFMNSARTLSHNPAQFGRLLTGFDPAPMLATLARHTVAEPPLGLAKPHFFSFGGSDRTAAFIKSLATRAV